MKFQGVICEILKFRRIICHWPKFHGIICILPKYKIPNISQQSSHFTSLSPNLAVSQVTASIFDAFCNFSPQQKHVVAKKSPVGSASLKSQHFVLVFWRTQCSVFVPSKMEKGVIKGNLGISHKFFFFFSTFIKKKFLKKKKKSQSESTQLPIFSFKLGSGNLSGPTRRSHGGAMQPTI